MNRRAWVLALLLIMLTTCLSGCRNSVLAEDKVFSFAVNTIPSTLDPSRCNSILDNELQHAVTEGLTRTTAGVISPGIAESWDISEDGKVYTFHLRDANWSDGIPVTAGDFVYSWRRLADPATGSEYGFATWMIEGGKDVNLRGKDPSTLGVRAIDDKTLEVRLTNPTAYFLGYIGSSANFAPIRQDLVESLGSDFASDAASNVYSGPFILSSSGEEEWLFTKNPEFWDAENIRLEGARMLYIEDTARQGVMFENEELDFAHVPNDRVPRYRDEDYVNHYLNGNMDFCYINVESDNEVLRNVDFRQALNYALNRNECNHDANNSVYKPYGALVFPGLTGKDGVTYGEAYDVDAYAYPLDGEIDTARTLLRNTMEDLDIKTTSDISVDLLVMDDPKYLAVAEQCQRQWNEVLGINIKLRIVSRKELYDDLLPAGEYELAIAGWGADYNDPYTYLEIFTSDNTSYTTYSNPEYDALIEATITERDETKRMDMLNEAEQMLINDAAFIPIQARDVYYMLNPAVTDLKLAFTNITLDWAYADISE